jgi:ribose transport system ATP-binding protein
VTPRARPSSVAKARHAGADTIDKSFGGSRALRGVSVSFAPGEVVALVGENGAGKSTLLKVLAAVVPRDGGHATLNGRPYDPRHQRDAEAQGVSLVFQELNVNRSLSIAENVMLGRLRDFRRFGLIDWRRLHREAQAILDRIGAEFSVRDDVTRLDLGQVKTVEVARALATNPRFVFFDESTAFLSHAEASRLMLVIRELKSQDIAWPCVPPPPLRSSRSADRLVVLKDGGTSGLLPSGRDERGPVPPAHGWPGLGRGVFRSAARPCRVLSPWRFDRRPNPLGPRPSTLSSAAARSWA